MDYIEGKIAAILDRSTVVINRGSTDGVSKGDSFYIYSELGPFYDPDTHENLGVTKKIWGKVVVSIVAERFCVAQTESDYYPQILPKALARIWVGEQVELPVEEKDITRGVTRIRVGFPVILERRVATIEESRVESPERQPIGDERPSALPAGGDAAEPGSEQ